VAVVRPATTTEVVAVVQACRAHGWPFVAQGGNTGLVGGSVSLRGEVLVSTRRLDDIGPVDCAAGQVTVGAGATLAAVQGAVAGTGWRTHVDLGARSAATIGGMVATNAGGTQVLRFGAMRARVAGVELVTGAGRVVSHLGGLTKDNTGYDIASLVCGSEGTLGIVTAVRLGLVQEPGRVVTVAIGLADVATALAVLDAVRRSGAVPEAAEFVTRRGVDLVRRELGIEVAPAYEEPFCLLLDLDLGSLDTDRVLDAVAAAVTEAAGEAPVAVGLDAAARSRLWAPRERHTEAVNRLGPPVKLDVTVPLDRVEVFCAQMASALPDVVLFGHLGDGNVHVNIPGAGADEVAADRLERVVLEAVVEMGGSISAEHGIGTAKRAHLHLSRTPEEIELFASIKAAFDPAGIANPHVLLPPDGAPSPGPPGDRRTMPT
jgi:FAD/FMN-containing dehydrogenase